MKLTVILALLALLTACGGQPAVEEAVSAEEAASAADSEPVEETAEEEAAVESPAEEATEPMESPAAAAAVSAVRGDEYEDIEGYPRTVADMLGREVTFDAPPERVVALYNNNFVQLATLGVRPVAGIAADEILANDVYFFVDGKEIPSVWAAGDSFIVDLELIAFYEPDLILVWGEEEVQQMRDIAPVFAVTGAEDFSGMIDHLQRLGQVFDMEDTVKEAIDAFNDRLAAYEALAPEYSPSILYVNAVDTNTFWVNQAPTPECEILNVIATCEWTLGVDGPTSVTIEGLLELDPDVILIANESDMPNDEFFAALADEPLWNELPAVQNDLIINDGDEYENFKEPRATALALATQFLDMVIPAIFPEAFPDGPLTDEQVQEIVGGETAAPTEGFPVTIEDRLGREFTFDGPPERIVCFYNGCMRGLGALGYPVAFPEESELNAEFIDAEYYPGFAENVTVLARPGGDIDAEAVAEFQPDLIIAYGEDEIASFEAIAPVFAEYDPDTLNGVIESFIDYGRIVGRAAEAQEIAQYAFDRLEAYKTLSPNDVSFMTVGNAGSGELWIRTSNSSECQVLQGIALCDWPDPTGGSSWSYEGTTEAVLDLNPDVIYLANWSSDVGATDELLDAFINDPLIAESDAAQNGRIYNIAGYDNPTGQGVMAMTKLLDIYMPLLYPDIFPEPLTDEQVQEIVGSESNATNTAEESKAIASTAGYPFTVTDAAGHELTLDSTPNSVMCMWNGCVSDMAFVGVMPAAVTEGVEDLGGHPSHFGDAFSDVTLIPREENLPNLEELLAFAPDLVIGNTEGYEATNSLLPSYEQNYETATLDLFFFDARNYARMFGLEEQTEARIERLLDRAEAYGIASGREKSIYFGFPNDAEGSSWVINGGDATCGFIQPEGQCTANYNDEWQDVSVEGLLAIDPDVFIIEDHGGEYGEEARAALVNLEENPLWQELSAVQNEQIHLIPRAISRPGYPLTLELWLDEIMPLAYPDLFPKPLTDEQVQEILAE